MELQKITTKAGVIYFIDPTTGQRVVTENDRLLTKISRKCGHKIFQDSGR